MIRFNFIVIPHISTKCTSDFNQIMVFFTTTESTSALLQISRECNYKQELVERVVTVLTAANTPHQVRQNRTRKISIQLCKNCSFPTKKYFLRNNKPMSTSFKLSFFLTGAALKVLLMYKQSTQGTCPNMTCWYKTT